MHVSHCQCIILLDRLSYVFIYLYINCTYLLFVISCTCTCTYEVKEYIIGCLRTRTQQFYCQMVKPDAFIVQSLIQNTKTCFPLFVRPQCNFVFNVNHNCCKRLAQLNQLRTARVTSAGSGERRSIGRSRGRPVGGPVGRSVGESQVSGTTHDLVYYVRNVDSFHFCKKSIVRADEMW